MATVLCCGSLSSWPLDTPTLLNNAIFICRRSLFQWLLMATRTGSTVCITSSPQASYSQQQRTFLGFMSDIPRWQKLVAQAAIDNQWAATVFIVCAVWSPISQRILRSQRERVCSPVPCWWWQKQGQESQFFSWLPPPPPLFLSTQHLLARHRRCQIEFVMTNQPFTILMPIVDKLYKKIRGKYYFLAWKIKPFFCVVLNTGTICY